MLAAAAMVLIQASHDTGVRPGALLGNGAVFDAIAVSEVARAWIVVAVFALPVAVTLRLNTRWLGHAVLLIPTVIAVVATAVTGNAGEGPGLRLRDQCRDRLRVRSVGVDRAQGGRS